MYSQVNCHFQNKRLSSASDTKVMSNFGHMPFNDIRCHVILSVETGRQRGIESRMDGKADETRRGVRGLCLAHLLFRTKHYLNAILCCNLFVLNGLQPRRSDVARNARPHNLESGVAYSVSLICGRPASSRARKHIIILVLGTFRVEIGGP